MPGLLLLCNLHLLLLMTGLALHSSVLNTSYRVIKLFAGNTSALADLLLGSAYLANGDLLPSANNLSATFASAGLPTSQQQQAYTQAIKYAIERGNDAELVSISTVTILVAAAVQAHQTASLSSSFAQVLQQPCGL